LPRFVKGNDAVCRFNEVSSSTSANEFINAPVATLLLLAETYITCPLKQGRIDGIKMLTSGLVHGNSVINPKFGAYVKPLAISTLKGWIRGQVASHDPLGSAVMVYVPTGNESIYQNPSSLVWTIIFPGLINTFR
jgi:hypothetical protein